jgi:hypothetical protein
MCLLAGLLLACLACTEFPELLTLTDNATNDFTVFLSCCDKGSTTVEALNRAPLAPSAKANHGTAHGRLVLTVAPAAPAPQDLLALHCLWRT